MIIHVVAPGETLSNIAAQYAVSPSRLSFDNQLSEQDHLVVGQALLVLQPDLIHETTPGETIPSIADLYGVPALQIVRNNPFLTSQPFLRQGQYLVIRYKDQSDRPLTADGYAYPFINMKLLGETLPYLGYLSIFSYGFTEFGELIPIYDEPLLEAARVYGTKAVFVLTPFTEAGTFNSNLVTIASQNMEVQENLMENIQRTVQNKGYSEVDVDFEYIRAEDRLAYVEFVRRLTRRMNAVGITVSVALAPKVSADQPGRLYEGVDYRLLGEAANSVLLMTYEWGYTYGPPMAVAPIPSVRQVLEYAVTEIPPEKISMGIPNYGYDWPLPFVRGETAAVTIGNQQAVAIAAANNAVIQYDEVSQAPFFEYNDRGTDHIVWFEDVRSILAKFQLVKEFGFPRVDYWQLMRSFRQNWLLLCTEFSLSEPF